MDREIKADLLIFDLDGTLVDTGIDITNAVNYIRTKSDLPPMKTKEVIVCVGNGLRLTLQECLADRKENIEDAIGLFVKYYGKHLLDNSTLYPSVKPVLEHYKTKKKVVISNKLESYCKKILTGLGIDHYFDIIWGRDSISKPKPDPTPILEAIKVTNTPPELTVMIGDGVNDMLSARSAGIKSCAVGCGFGEKSELMAQKPTCFINSLENIVKFIK